MTPLGRGALHGPRVVSIDDRAGVTCSSGKREATGDLGEAVGPAAFSPLSRNPDTLLFTDAPDGLSRRELLLSVAVRWEEQTRF